MRLFHAMMVLACAALPAAAQMPEVALTSRIDHWESRLDARIGVVVQGADWVFGHRADERFPMTSAVKVPICGAVLARVDQGDVSLAEDVLIAADDILDWAPVTAAHVGADMSIGDLCFAALDQSDNTAANLLFHRLGGPNAVTAFLRGIGDGVTRSDRTEPTLNEVAPGDARDTTTPQAAARWMDLMLTRDVLSPGSRAQLAEWMRPGAVTGALLRPLVPAGWDVVDKSGNGRTSRALVAMVGPPEGAPVTVTMFIADTTVGLAQKDEAMADIGAAAMQMIVAR
ncbi:class A beta-lactamase [Falsirhodobacter halotolerans]|uniref:class A beta-lactamase n=1 Tax=Falsirhodobacter halotolerans TaxID=1146892 RepID=UPI001FD1C951|nr:class A beta-lactamase [Falsirhodobacter halotolerans]MCJ8139255.1 class A beta-lactamase [Falsirhodobacter halotolerans]